VRLGAPWLGAVSKAEQTDTAFVQFTDAVYGLRAIGKILLNYQKQTTDHPPLRTIKHMISRWAPAGENDTDAYIHSVSQHMQWPEDASIDLSESTSMFKEMIEAIVKHENGMQPYTDDQLWHAVKMALL